MAPRPSDALLSLRSDDQLARLVYDGNEKAFAVIVERYKRLNLPTYWAGINTELTAQVDAKGNVTSVKIAYPRDAVKQYLSYGRMYER